MPETTLATIHFPPALRDWITQGLQRGGAPDHMAQALASQGYDPLVARELVAAFARARREGTPAPRDSITVSRAVPAAAGGPRLAQGTLLRAADRDVRVLSRMDQPIVAVLEGVLSHDECDALVAMAQPRLAPSTTVDPSTGFTVVSEGRTSHGMFFRLQENALVARLDQRISALMRLPVENGEGLQVLRYGVGAQSSPHYDFLMPTNAANQASLARSGQRVSTLVVYLNDVEAGGETAFPEIGYAVSPRKGNAVYFEYCDAAGQLDGRTLHTGAPVRAGEKWVVTKWMRQRRFVPAGGEPRMMAG
ncbi:2OG-Fe(II) oxygenase [Cupriavidus basilensis]|uniref:2OG-Fe(II) oxygenase n=2 Tax=Cupriavidus TaxID=106589 RepID=UPI0007511E8E|nr:2OG-Fe(II) oxygenase [Cupriavidus basilensis]